jgi:hypothetical protein
MRLMADDEELDDPFKTENRQWPDPGKARDERELREDDGGHYRRSREGTTDWTIPRPRDDDED